MLSGFVLSLSLRRAGGTFGALYFRFAVRRVFPDLSGDDRRHCGRDRTHLPLPHASPSGSLYMYGLVSQPITPAVILKQLALISFMNPVTWTLRMEMVCSLLLPLALWLERRRPRALLVVLAVLIILGQMFPR